MSEYQYVHFMAFDRPLDEKQLAFMRQQSTRAKITQWEFCNEYHFGDFHGNAREMLRHGYDLHLHFANFGIRRLMIRLPAGLPCDRPTFDAFCVEDGIVWNADKRGPGGILEIQPEADAGTYDDDLYEVDGLLPAIAPLRAALIGGDLRPLYLAWLACCCGEDREPPVPAGLDTPTPALCAMAKFYSINRDLITAAAQGAPPLPEPAESGGGLNAWLAKQPRDAMAELLRRLLGDDGAAARAETLSRIRDDCGAATWPLAEPSRTIAQLIELANGLGRQRQQREQQAAAKARRQQLAAIAKDPEKTIAAVRELVKMRSVQNYEEAATALADLREALGPEAGPARARAVAQSLRRQNPQLNRLTAALRKRGLLD